MFCSSSVYVQSFIPFLIQKMHDSYIFLNLLFYISFNHSYSQERESSILAIRSRNVDGDVNFFVICLVSFTDSSGKELWYNECRCVNCLWNITTEVSLRQFFVTGVTCYKRVNAAHTHACLNTHVTEPRP
jgi:hypothetical protein